MLRLFSCEASQMRLSAIAFAVARKVNRNQYQDICALGSDCCISSGMSRWHPWELRWQVNKPAASRGHHSSGQSASPNPAVRIRASWLYQRFMVDALDSSSDYILTLKMFMYKRRNRQRRSLWSRATQATIMLCNPLTERRPDASLSTSI